MRENTIVTLTGPSLSGKSTLQKELSERLGLTPIVSHTTRSPRVGETDGLDYHYVSEQEFSEIPMAETAMYAGYRYGISKKEIEKSLPAVVTIETSGLEQLIKLSKKERKFSVMGYFIGLNQSTMIERWIERAIKDGPENYENNLSRLRHNLKNIEMKMYLKWKELFADAGCYSDYIERLDDDTRDRVVHKIGCDLDFLCVIDHLNSLGARDG